MTTHEKTGRRVGATAAGRPRSIPPGRNTHTMTTDPQTPTLGRPLTETERTMLRYALDQAQEQMLCVGDEFSENDHDAVDSLRRLADAAPRPEPPVHGESVAHLAGDYDEASKREPDPDCERCNGSGLDPDAYFVDKDRNVWTHAPCSECLPEDDTPEPATERVKHSGPDTEFCVLCLSGEHERVDEPAVDARQDGAQS